MSTTQIFISYARDDDAAPPDLNRGEAKGFVTSLHEQLLYEFQELGQPRPKIWRDTRGISPGDQFEPLLDEAIAASSLLLVVLSRNWLTRPYCLRELEAFSRRWNKEDDRALRQRLVVVAKHYVDPQQRPSLLQGQEGFSFFTLDAQADPGQEHEFFARGAIRDPRYQDRVRDLGSYLWRSAARLDKAVIAVPVAAAQGAKSPSPQTTGRTLYLAKPAVDMREAYGRLVDELHGRGYAIVPPATEEIPNDASATEFVNQALAAAELSIHLLGEKTGYSPEDVEPIVKLQLSLAGAHVPAEADGTDTWSRSFRRIVWAPKVLEEAANLERKVERDPLAVLAKFNQQLATDKVEGDSLSKFVDFLFQHLDRTAPPREALEEIKADSRVYIYHRPEDSDYALSIAKALQQRQIEPVLPALEGDAAELSAFHKQNLLDCDAVLLCWASASEVWVRVTSRELKNWHDLGRDSQFAWRGLVTGPPSGDRKKAFVQLPPRNEIDVVVDLTGHNTLPPEALDALVQGAHPKAP
jgi:TIR domain